MFDNFFEDLVKASSKISDFLLNEMMMMPSRIKGDDKLGYRFEYMLEQDKLPETGTTPKDVILEIGSAKLYHYKSNVKKKYKEPILFVYALINRSYILDLFTGNSVVEYFLNEGYDVYMLDWGDFSDEDRFLTLSDLIDIYIHESVEKVKETSKSDTITLFGWCIGGNLALLYTALYQNNIKNLVCLTTPGKPSSKGILWVWSEEEIAHINKLVDAVGNIPGKLIRYGVMSLYPYRELKKNAIFYDNIENKIFLHHYGYAEKWMNDNIDFPGQVFKQYVKDVVQTDTFVEGKTVINERCADLSNITCSFLNLAGEEDNIVPVESTEYINEKVSSKDKEFRLIPGGHVGMAFDPRTIMYRPNISSWINERSTLL